MKPKLAILIVLAFVATAAPAHNGMDHVIGIVSKLTETTITVAQQKDHTPVEVMTTKDTIYERGNIPAHRADLKLGDRVVIHAVKVNGRLQAHEVQFADASASTVQHSKFLKAVLSRFPLHTYWGIV
jgi:hypothetical protein